MFQLGKLEFEVKDATLYGGYCDASIYNRGGGNNTEDSFSWHLEICMEKNRIMYEPSKEGLEELDEEAEPRYETVSPSLYHNNGFELDISSWKDMEGMVLNWEEEYNEKEEDAGYLYVFGHEQVTAGRIEFIERRGQAFLIRWSGTANVFWNDEYGSDVPFVFEGVVPFMGIRALSDVEMTEEELRTAMNKYINMGELLCQSQSSHEITNGTSYVWNFVPVE